MAQQKDERGDAISRTHESSRKNFSARETRQGGPGVPVLKVLGASLVLALLVWGAVELWGNKIDPTPPTSQTRDSTTTDGEPAQNTFDNNVPQGTEETVPTDRDPTPQSGTGGDSQTVTPDGTSN
jgi:hypothetical protein